MSITANSEECTEPSDDQDNKEDINEVLGPKDDSKCCQKCWTSKTQVYISHFLSSCGDRMWMFAGGLFLLKVTPDSLRLAAFYGASLAFVVIVFGAPVGRWVDHTHRLRAVQISLAIQNIMVCVCAAILVMMIEYRDNVELAWNGAAMPVAQVAVIVTACLAQIGTLGSKLTIEKDWIIVICGQDKSQLARMNSILRSLDLSTEVFAPVLVGFIMTGFGMSIGGIFIACWNIASLFLEYGILHSLYHSTPALHRKEETEEQVPLQAGYRNEPLKSWKQRIASAWSAWVLYMNHPVRDAGLGLALLFLTVLAFDNYSRAYVFNLGVAESVLGGLTALASLLGILGSIVFPKLRQKVGLNTTGLIGFSLELLCLSFCVVSIFLPGSPFELAPGYKRMHSVRNSLSSSDDSLNALFFNKSTPMNLSDSLNNPSTPVFNEVTNVSESLEILSTNDGSVFNGEESMTSFNNMTNYTKLEDNEVTNETTANVSCSSISEESHSYISVGLLLMGIISSRFGLWVADLTVTQILQEGVAEGERGSINGVQQSLNQTLDMCRSILLILLPSHSTFGYLVVISFCFVGAGGLMFFLYTQHPPRDLQTSEVLDGQEISLPTEDLDHPSCRE